MAKLSNQSSNGTSFHNSTITASVNELIAALGEPQYQSNDGEDKVNFEWDCETEEGAVFTIYDWKTYNIRFSIESLERWNIGGKVYAADFIEYIEKQIKNK